MEEKNVYEKITEVSEKEQEAFFAKQNVVGVGTGHKIKKRSWGRNRT